MRFGETHRRSKRSSNWADANARPGWSCCARSATRRETVQAILADVNIQGQVELLVALMRAEPWREFWEELQIGYVTFAEAGLDRRARDAVIWQFCQQQEFVLVTNNRNDDGPDSLEATHRALTTPQSLPVFTLAD